MKPNNLLLIKISPLKVSRNFSTVILLVGCLVGIFISPQNTFAAKLPIDCSRKIFCTSADQKTITLGTEQFQVFDETNFLTIKDQLGRPRKFWVHIPPIYDKISGQDLKIPVIFAFHGWNKTDEPRESMVAGKWGSDYFEKDIAFVIPVGEYSPCHLEEFGRVWLGPLLTNYKSVPSLPTCNRSTQILDGAGIPITYFSANLTDTFTDVNFIEQLRAMVLSRFPKLNANKVYATGFSLGGGMTQYLLCYRSSLFRGFSIVSATLLNGNQQRGDHDGNPKIQTTDANSLVATCGKTQWDAGHATGITNPDLWGYGLKLPLFNKLRPVFTKVPKPIVLFAGDHDSLLSVQDIEDTTAEIISRNNLDPVAINLGINTLDDNSISDYSVFNLPVDRLQSSSIFTIYKVTRTDVKNTMLLSAAHAMPDADEIKNPFMTRDYNYTDETINFFETHADLNLNP